MFKCDNCESVHVQRSWVFPCAVCCGEICEECMRSMAVCFSCSAGMLCDDVGALLRDDDLSGQEIAERIILWHRYRYYVCAHPTLTDGEYDRLEHTMLELFPASQVLQLPGSDSPADYPEAVRRLFKKT
jgi:hypothetical protein